MHWHLCEPTNESYNHTFFHLDYFRGSYKASWNLVQGKMENILQITPPNYLGHRQGYALEVSFPQFTENPSIDKTLDNLLEATISTRIHEIKKPI